LPTTLFISDLHLSPETPHITRLLLDFLSGPAAGADALYILGDLFEYWAGDDDLPDPYHQQVTGALRQVSASGTKLYLMHGNRDLLMGRDFAAACGATLLQDPLVIDLHGVRTLLSHGDILCTDDVEYQAFRRQVHDPEWQRVFLAQPLALRKAQITGMRERSKMEKTAKSDAIMDVNAGAVATLFRQHGIPDRLIHGHTHRQARHALEVDGKNVERVVLGDWGAVGNCLVCSPGVCDFREIE
jgi:UDP-2,3-diacylglucosamine hydrolase